MIRKDKNMDNIDFDWDESVGQLDEYDDYYYTTSSEWFDERSTWRSIFFSFPENNKQNITLDKYLFSWYNYYINERRYFYVKRN